MTVSEAGNPICIIRNLVDGTQEQLDPKTRDVVRTFAKNSDGLIRHYVKQDDEKSTFVPGDEEKVRIVQHIFKRRYVDGWTTGRIAKELNDLGHVSPKGSLWYETTVKELSSNSIYLGVGYANRYSASCYYSRGKSSPVPTSVLRQKTGQKTKILYRPEEDWEKFEYPELVNYLSFLTPELRADILRRQRNHMRKKSLRALTARGGDRHDDSDYFLKYILRSKQGNHAMTGQISINKQGRCYRYYGVSRAKTAPATKSPLRRLIRAEILEDAALAACKEALRDFDGLEDTVAKAFEAQKQNISHKGCSAAAITAQREKILKQIDFWVGRMGGVEDAIVESRVETLKQKLISLTAQLEEIEQHKRDQPLTSSSAYEALMKRCKEILNQMDQLPRAAIRRILSLIVKKMTVDLETYEVDLQLHMPLWVLKKPSFNVADVCLQSQHDPNSRLEANAVRAIEIAQVKCIKSKVKRTPCLTCRRRAA